jgi:thioredoxin-like negative regulator of GroEL
MDSIYNIFNKYRNYIYIGAAVIVALVVIWMIMKHFKQEPKIQHQIEEQQPDAQETTEQFTDSDKATKLVIFYAPWCPHCKSMMEGEGSVWGKLKQKLSGRKDVVLDQVNCDEQPDVATKFGIKGYPTILKINKDKVEHFEGDRTLEALENFIN